jgi:hypothetical protein
MASTMAARANVFRISLALGKSSSDGARPFVLRLIVVSLFVLEYNCYSAGFLDFSYVVSDGTICS